MVEFGDLECPACKAAQPNITKLLADEPKMRLVFQNYPLEQIHKWAMIGAKYLDCVGQENGDAVWKFIATVYEHQGEINEQNADQMLKGYAKDAGANPDTVAACVANPETEKRVRDLWRWVRSWKSAARQRSSSTADVSSAAAPFLTTF